MDSIGDPWVSEVVVMSSAQIGKTEILLNGIGYYATQDPAAQLMIQPTIEMSEAISKDRVAPMIRLCPSLLEAFGDPASRKTGNNLRHKQFPGGYLTLAGANSPASLASRPVRIVWGDEIDRWPASAGAEGDPVMLAKKRTATYHNSKHVWVSTPTHKDASRIEKLFLAGDQRYRHVPCPHCGEYQRLEFSNLHWDNPMTAAWFECPHCKENITEDSKGWMLDNAQWVAEKEFKGIASFAIWEAYSKWRRWTDIAEDFLGAKKSPETLQAFVNTSLGEPFEDRAASVETPDPSDACEEYGAEVHEDVDVLTCGVDVHDNRIEAVVYGWDADETAYAVDHLIIGGPAEGQRVWRELDDLLSRGFEKADGSTLTIAAMCVDSGHQTQKVYDFVKPRQGRRVWAVKGVGGEGRPIIMAPARRKVGDSKIPVELHTVGVDEAKSTIYARLLDGDRFHFPSTEQFSEEFFRQLTSEKCVTKYRSGVAFRQWVKVRARNEILDCTVYALAAIKRLRPNWKVIKARRAAAELSDKNPDKGRISRPRRRSSYMHRWK